MSDQTAQMKTWRWRIFAATWLSYFGLYFARKPFYIVKATLEENFGWNPEALGTLGAVYLITYTIGQFVSGGLGQKWGPRVVLLGGMALAIGANAAMGFSNSFGSFAVLMALNGLGQSTGWSNTVGTMGRWFRREERGRVMGVWATNYQVGGVLANLLAAFVAGALGFKYAFFTGSAVLLVVWVFVYFNQANKPQDVGLEPLDDPLEDAIEAAENEQGGASWPREIVFNIVLIGCFYFFVKFIRYALWSWAPYLLETELGMTTEDAGYLSTIFDLCGIAGVIACGWMSDKLFDNRRAGIALIFILGMAVSCALLYTVGTTSAVLFGTSLGLIGFTLYGPDALMTGAGAIDVGSARRATMAAGIINGMGSVGSVMQEFVFGKVLSESSSGFAFAILLGAALAAAGCLGVLLVRRRAGHAAV